MSKDETRINIAEVDLLPCPFCGGKPETDYWEGDDENAGSFTIGCTDGCCHLHDPFPEELVNEWNTREGKLLVEQVPEVVGKFRMAYHGTYVAINIFKEMREVADWMAKVMKPENANEYEDPYNELMTLKDLSHELKSLGWVRKEDEEEYQRNFSKKMTAYAERFFVQMDFESDKSADCLIKAFKDHVKEQDEKRDS